MKIVQCKNGHYYDADKFKSCPVCAQGKAGQEERERKTAALFYSGDTGKPGVIVTPHSGGEQDRRTERYFDKKTPGDNARTIGLYRIRNVNPPAGWLVCRSGECRGRFYTIYDGINTIGTSHNMDIVLQGEKVCQENHASLTYDGRNADFYICPKNGSVHINGQPVTGQNALHADDLIELGGLGLDFIPYCTKTRNWNKTNDTPPDGKGEKEKRGKTDEKE